MCRSSIPNHFIRLGRRKHINHILDLREKSIERREIPAVTLHEFLVGHRRDSGDILTVPERPVIISTCIVPIH